MVACFTLDCGFFGLAAARLTARLRRHAFDALLRQDMGFFDAEDNSAGELTSFLAEKNTLMESLTGGSAQVRHPSPMRIAHGRLRARPLATQCRFERHAAHAHPHAHALAHTLRPSSAS